LLVGLLLVCILYSLYVLERSLAPALIAIAEMKAANLATEAVARAVHDHLAQSVDYRRMIHVEKDDMGRVALMQPNTSEIVRVQAASMLAIQQAVMGLNGTTIDIPMGQALRATLFANLGPNIRVGVQTLGVPRVQVRDKFEEAGINNVRHLVYLESEVDMRVVIPLVSREIRVLVNSPLAEAIIPGEVPSTYLRFSL